MRTPSLVAGTAVVAVLCLSASLLGQDNHGRTRTAAAATPVAQGRHWVTSWTAAQTPPVPGTLSGTGLHDQTVRDTVHLATTGDLVRVTLSAAAGHPLRVGAGAVAVRSSGRTVLRDTRRVLTFGGLRPVTVPAGRSVVSDPVRLAVPAGSTLAVSVYLPGRSGPLSAHPSAHATGYLAAGDQTMASRGAAYATRIHSWPVVSRVETLSPGRTLVAVGFGDSITDGTHSLTDANSRWSDQADSRLRAVGSPWAVVNSGIAGNRLTGQHSPGMGVSGENRFQTDALGVSGVRAVVLLEGINDLRFGEAGSGRVEAGYRDLVARAHTRGLLVVGVTLLPAEGSAGWSASRQHAWAQTNAFIRDSHVFDAVVDAAAVLAAPGHPDRLNPAYDSGDHLHPDDAGYTVLGSAIAVTLATLPA